MARAAAVASGSPQPESSAASATMAFGGTYQFGESLIEAAASGSDEHAFGHVEHPCVRPHPTVLFETHHGDSLVNQHVHAAYPLDGTETSQLVAVKRDRQAGELAAVCRRPWPRCNYRVLAGRRAGILLDRVDTRHRSKEERHGVGPSRLRKPDRRRAWRRQHIGPVGAYPRFWSNNASFDHDSRTAPRPPPTP